MNPPEPEHIGVIAGMVMRDDGTLRWPVIVGGVIASGVLAVGGWLISTTANLARVEARQEIVMKRLDVLETSNHPSTAKRFTSDDAREMEIRLVYRIDKLEERFDRNNGK